MKTLNWMTLAALAAFAAACATQPQSAPTTIDAADGPVTFGGFSTPEAATYDAAHDRFLVGNVGGRGDPDNDGFIVALNPDGTVQTLRWVEGSDMVQLASPLGVEAANGVLYAADTPFIRRFDLATAAQLPSIEVPGAAILNDLDVANDGTIYVNDMGSQDPTTWRVVKIAPDGTISTLVSGEALGRPNGLDIGPDGLIYLAPVATANIVVVDPASGAVVRTIPLPGPSNDGIIVRANDILVSQPGPGTLYSVTYDGEATLIAQTPGGASIGYDPGRAVVIVPQLQRNAVSLYAVD